MISLTLSMYLTAAGVIGLLIAFSAHNRKTGWKKSRTTLADALNELYADLGLVSGEQEPVLAHSFTMQARMAPVDPSEYSLQLLNLRNALGTSTGITKSAPAAHQQNELVAARSR